jgi:hypothetical protein
MQWAAADQHVKVINMSLGGPGTSGVDPLEQAVQTLTTQYGTLFVIRSPRSPAAARGGRPGDQA